MAVVVAGALNLDMRDLSVGALLESEVVSRSSSQYVLNHYGEILTFRGSGFVYDAYGVPMSGTVNSLNVTYQGNLIYQVSGFSTPVTSWLAWASNDDTLGAFMTVLAGSDTVTGNFGNDVLASFNGDDSLTGESGNDWLEGGSGADTVLGGAGDDTMFGGDAGTTFNYLWSGTGNDHIQGGAGFDNTHGNQGNDTVLGGAGDDWVVGGQDNDLLYGEAGADIVVGNLGTDTLYGGDGDDRMHGGQGNDTLQGGAGNDLLLGDRGDDTITGGTGADQFWTHADAGADRVLDFNGAEGDRIKVEYGAVTIAQAGQDTTLSFGTGSQMVLVGVTNFVQGWILTG